MYKASRELKETLAKVDLVIEILDARIPFSSQNPLLAKLRHEKPCFKILNKSDLADPKITEAWQQYLNRKKNLTTYSVTKNKPEKIKYLIEIARKLIKIENADRTVTALVMGIPNVGKSTIINILAKKIIAITGNEPAVTKRQQRITITKNFALIDTPGILWPNLENQNSAYRLAAAGAIKDRALVHEDVAYFTVEFLISNYPEKLIARFGIDPSTHTTGQLIEKIGHKRGCLKPGGVVDQDKVAKIILTDLRMGNLGRISLENPELIEQEAIDLDLRRQQAPRK